MKTNKCLPSWIKENGLITVPLYRFSDCSIFDEDRITRMMMSKYGINKVRGGSYSLPVLPNYVQSLLSIMVPNDFNYYEKQRWIICCILLEHDKYFIIRLNDLNELTYFINVTSKKINWLVNHPYKRIVGIKKRCSWFDTDMYVIAAMSKFGIENVRGGSFVFSYIIPHHRGLLKKFIETAYDHCYICHKKGHFSHECRISYENYTEQYSEQYSEDSSFDSSEESLIDFNYLSNNFAPSAIIYHGFYYFRYGTICAK
jgi:hypothetical protein